MSILHFLTLHFFLNFNLQALEYSKIEFVGCPENSFCKKETGENRKKWLDQLKSFTQGELSEQKLNAFIQAEYGLPISGWAQEETSLLPNVIMWDSPCSQHRSPVNKYYISDVFRKNLKLDELKELPSLIFTKAIVLDHGKNPNTFLFPRGEVPQFIKDGSFYFLREEEGLFYGLLIDREGRLKVTKKDVSHTPPKEVPCPKEFVAEFVRLAPGPNFYLGQICKDVWDTKTKDYKTVILGWSCH